MDLGGLWRGELTVRRVRVLIEHLPVESATAHAVAGLGSGALASWSLAEVLLGRLIDEVAIHRWQWESAHVGRGPHRKPPASVLPELPSAAELPADVIPMVSPHQLGRFVNDQEA